MGDDTVTTQAAPLAMTTTRAREGGKAPASTVKGWSYTAEFFPAGQHTIAPGGEKITGQLADVYARHTGMFALDLDLYKAAMAEMWAASATGRYLAGRAPYVHRGTEGSVRFLIVMTPEQAAEWWPAASGTPWGDIRSAGLAPSPGAIHPSGDTYEAVPGPDLVIYPDGTRIWTNVIRFDAGLKAALEADGAHGADDREMIRDAGDANLPADDGRCDLVARYLENRDFTGATPRGSRANAAVNYLKRLHAEGCWVGGWIGEVIAALPATSQKDFEDMWATAPVPAGTVRTGHDCGGAIRDFYAAMHRQAVNGQQGPAGTAPGQVPDSQLAEIAARYAPVDWHEAWKAQPEDVDWDYYPLLERGTVNALFARAGTGKSLIAEEISWELARDGKTVVYVDDENRIADLVERFRAMGAAPEDLAARLKMYSFASLPPLDTPEGGWHLLALAVTNGAHLVVLDTTTRMVTGRENDADTFIQLYRCALVPLKARGITVLRLDHPGKDESRGQRGSSAKDGDVDTIWHMTEVVPESVYRMTRTKNRPGHAPGAGMVTLSRKRDPLRHILSFSELSAVTRLAEQIADSGVPVEAGRPAVREALAKAGVKVANSLLTQAIRYRKELSRTAADSADNSAAGPDCPSAPHIGADSRTAPLRDTKPEAGKPVPDPAALPVATPEPRVRCPGGFTRSPELDDAGWDVMHRTICRECYPAGPDRAPDPVSVADGLSPEIRDRLTPEQLAGMAELIAGQEEQDRLRGTGGSHG